MNRIHPDMLKQLKDYYLPGTRVVLIQMDDPYSKLLPGDKGTVRCVDDIGTIHVTWDRGSSLGIVYGVDCCRKIEE
jgi:hypothetical protein